MLTIGEGIWGFQASMVAPTVVLSVLLTTLGASDTMIGSISSIEIGALLLPQLLGMWFFRSNRNKQKRVILWHFIFIIPPLYLMGVVAWCMPLTSPMATRWLLLLLFLLFQGGIGTVLSVWLDWLSQIFPQEIRGTVFGMSWGTGALLGTLGGTLSGYLISHGGNLFTYGMLYLLAGVISTVSMMFFCLLKYDEPPDTGLQNMTPIEMFSTFGDSLRDENFRSFLFGRIMMMSAFCATPLIATFYQSPHGGSLPAGTIISCGAAMAAGLGLGNGLLGRMGDLWGHRWSLVAGAVLQVLALGLMLCTAGFWSCLMVYFLTGFANSANWATHSTMMIETCPHEHILSHITGTSLLLAPGAVLFPLLAGNMATLCGLEVVFGGSILLALLSIVWMIWKLKTPEPPQPAALLPSATH